MPGMAAADREADEGGRLNPHIPEWIDSELWNWSRWLWSGDWPHPIPPNVAASAEGRFIDPSDLYREPRKPYIMPNRERAEVVQEAWQNRMSERERLVIAAEYPRRHLDGRLRYGRAGVARRMRISLAMYETALRRAVRQVERAFGEERG